jgi:hypothetical protein
MDQKKADSNGKAFGEAKIMNSKVKKISTDGSGVKHQNGSHSAQSLSGFCILLCAVVAVASFTAGVLTLPALSFKTAHQSQQR